MSKLPSLVTLNIYHGLDINDIPHGVFRSEFVDVAESCFKRAERENSYRLTLPKFSLLCFGQENKYADSGKLWTLSDLPRQCFVRRKGRYDVHASRSNEDAGSTQTVRVISPQDARYLVGKSDIIDFDFFQFME